MKRQTPTDRITSLIQDMDLIPLASLSPDEARGLLFRLEAMKEALKELAPLVGLEDEPFPIVSLKKPSSAANETEDD